MRAQRRKGRLGRKPEASRFLDLTQDWPALFCKVLSLKFHGVLSSEWSQQASAGGREVDWKGCVGFSSVSGCALQLVSCRSFCPAYSAEQEKRCCPQTGSSTESWQGPKAPKAGSQGKQNLVTEKRSLASEHRAATRIWDEDDHTTTGLSLWSPFSR